MLSTDDILKLSDAARRNLRLAYGIHASPKKKRNANSATRAKRRFFAKPKKCWEKEDLIKYLRKHNIKRRIDLLALREDENAPTDYMVTKVFGNWDEARCVIYPGETWKSHSSAEYILKCVMEFKIWTTRQYYAARKANPEIIPPMTEVRERWGSFANLIECASRVDLRKMIEDYSKFVLSHDCKIPTSDMLQRKGLRIGEAVTLFGSKAKFDEFILEYIRGRVI